MLYIPNVVTLKLDESSCSGCGNCAIVCPQRVFFCDEKIAFIVCRDACMECGACAINCPTKAITVEAGVGCAVGILRGLLSRSTSACGCNDGPACC